MDFTDNNVTSDDNNPKVSIITVCFNSARTIRNTIESVINQTYQNIEYIIVDGGSSDGTVDIIKEYEPYIAKWVSEPDEGIYDAMNKGIRMSTGEIIGIINSDDWYQLFAIESVVYAMSSNIAIVYGRSSLIDETSGITYEVGRPVDQNLSYIMVIPHTAMFVHRKIYETNGLYNCNYSIAADHELILRTQIKEVKFIYMDRVLSFVRTGGVSGTKFGKTFYEYYLINRKYGQPLFLAILSYLRSICATSLVCLGLKIPVIARKYEVYKRAKLKSLKVS